MATQIHGKIQFVDTNGVPLSGGKVYTYLPGTTTDKASYTVPAATGGTENTQPVILNSRGEADIYVIGDCKIKVTDANDNLIYTLDNVGDLRYALSASSGSSLVGFIQSGTDAVATTMQAKSRLQIDVEDFIAAGDTDDAVGINKALQYAKTLVAATAQVGPNGKWIHPYGGAEVQLQGKNYTTTSATISIPANVILNGMGKTTGITSAIDGQIIRNEDDLGITYGYSAGGLCGLSVYGDRTKTSQIGVDLLRLVYGATFENVQVSGCGSHGVVLRECLTFNPVNVDSWGNVGRGFVLDEGVTSWAAMVANALPCNGNMLTNCTARFNDGAGVVFGVANKNTWIGGSLEYNYFATGTGYHAEFLTDANGNVMRDVWYEGLVLANVYSNTTNASQYNFIQDCYATPTGNALTTPTRFAIANKGIIDIRGYSGLTNAYPTVAGSTAPFRLNKTNGGKIVYRGPSIYGVNANLLHIEDEAGNLGNLGTYAYQEVQNASIKSDYGVDKHYYENGQVSSQYFRTTSAGGTAWETTPWLRFNNFTRSIEFDTGSAGNYTGIHYRTTTPEGALTAGRGSICLVGAGANANVYMKRSTGYNNTGWRPLGTNSVGFFTMANAATKTVADTNFVSYANTVVILTPINAQAAALQAGAAHLYIQSGVDDTSFTVATGDASSAAGTENFYYLLVTT